MKNYDQGVRERFVNELMAQRQKIMKTCFSGFFDNVDPFQRIDKFDRDREENNIPSSLQITRTIIKMLLSTKHLKPGDRVCVSINVSALNRVDGWDPNFGFSSGDNGWNIDLGRRFKLEKCTVIATARYDDALRSIRLAHLVRVDIEKSITGQEHTFKQWLFNQDPYERPPEKWISTLAAFLNIERVYFADILNFATLSNMAPLLLMRDETGELCTVVPRWLYRCD